MYNKAIPKGREKQGNIQFYQLNQGVNNMNRKIGVIRNEYNKRQNKKSLFTNGINE